MNPNPTQSDEFKEARKETQFGAPNGNPQRQDSTKPECGMNGRSVEVAVRYLAGQKLVNRNGKMTVPLPDEPTPAQYVAAKAWTMAAEGNLKAIIFVTERVDGKVVERHQEIPPPVETPEDCTSEEEAAAAHAQARK